MLPQRFENANRTFAIAVGLCAGAAFAFPHHCAAANTSNADALLEISSHTEGAAETLRLLVGRSMFVNTETRLRRVYVSNPGVLDSVTESPTRIVITARAPGVSSLLLTDEAGRSRLYLVVSDLDVHGLQSDLEKTFPGDHLQAEAQEGRISLYGTVADEASAESAVKLASLYSKDVANSLVVNPSRIKQVRLQVRIVEIDRSKLDQFGVNFFTGGKNIGASSSGQFPVSTSITGASSGSASSSFQINDPLNLLFYNTSINIGVAIKAMEDQQILQILAEPNITTVSGQKAEFLSGGEFPYPVVQGTSAGASSVTIQFRPYGVKLEFTPFVTPDGTIQLKVAPEVSALDYTNSVSISGFTIPALSTRRAETQVQLRDGQSFAISGLLDRRTTDSLGKVPVLGELPVLGQLFRSKNISKSIVELVVIVTPKIIDPLKDTAAPQQPHQPVPMLDPNAFDQKVVKAPK